MTESGIVLLTLGLACIACVVGAIIGMVKGLDAWGAFIGAAGALAAFMLLAAPTTVTVKAQENNESAEIVIRAD